MPAINCDQFTKILDDKLNPLNSTISELKKSVNEYLNPWRLFLMLLFQLFKSLEIIKFLDLVTFHLAIFMYKYHNQLLPSVFNSFFTKISQIHTYNTRLGAKQSYYLPKARTNYGIFNIRFQGPSVWNSIDEDIKLSSLSLFKKKMKQHFIKDY